MTIEIPMSVQERLPQEQVPLPGGNGQGYLDFQEQEWKCPGCGKIHSMTVDTCPKCGVSAYNVLQQLNKPKPLLSHKRGGRRIGIKAGFKFLISVTWLVVFLATIYLLLALSPVVIYFALPFLVLTAFICVLYPKKKNKKEAAKKLMEQLGEGMIELAALIEKQAGL